MNEFGKYKLYRKYFSEDGVNYTPLDEYQALLVENDSCQCGYREFEYRFDGEYKNETLEKYEIWNEPNHPGYNANVNGMNIHFVQQTVHMMS